MTEYRIIPESTHRSNGFVKVPLAVGKSGRVQHVPLTERQAIELAGKLLQGLKALATDRERAS